ncbi:MAG: hypothetical protein Tsb002_05790 [Wenzhouxiangellaceae bacterium]
MVRFFHLLFVIALLAGCASQERSNDRENTLRSFEAQVRFGNNFEALTNFIHPDYLDENPISTLELRQLDLYRVSGYRVRSMVQADDEMSLTQVVELRMYHKNTARERTVLYPQLWRYDNDRERWMLHSGLPELSNQ